VQERPLEEFLPDHRLRTGEEAAAGHAAAHTVVEWRAKNADYVTAYNE
jgi:hypothetical protein